MLTQVFSYGSNMSTARIRARVSSAAPLAMGYVTHRRLIFHKRGNDGSAKADAFYTGEAEDRIWGVVFTLKREEKPVLDEFEFGYSEEQIVVQTEQREISASVYVAKQEFIDASLEPFDWYHRYVVEGAREHLLPKEYMEELQIITTIDDPDVERRARILICLSEFENIRFSRSLKFFLL